MTSYKDNWAKLEEEPIGEGGQGRVYKVYRKSDPEKNPYIAKVFKKSESTSPERLNRFKREAETTQTLSHENIVKIIEFDVEAKEPYLILEYCFGGSLDQVKEQFWKNRILHILQMFQEICKGVSEAHKNNIIHRDIKPQNILLRSKQGTPVITDFGICYLQDEDRLTKTKQVVGARFFMAPEQEGGMTEDVTDKCDIYSLGKVLYWLIADDIITREDYRNYKYDLRKKYGDKMEYINSLLDKMIVYKPDERINITQVLEEVLQITRLFAGNYNLVLKGVTQNCYYCGIGKYTKRTQEGQPTKSEFGLGSENKQAEWRALVCNYCGNVQTFRTDFCKNADWLDGF